MKILHLFSDWKWTGPAEPTVSLCEALHTEGLHVTLAYRKTPMDFPERTVEKEAAQRNIPLYDGFRLNRYFSPKDWLLDIRHIKAYVNEKGIDIIHTHLSHDHFTALCTFMFLKKKPLIVRTDHKRDGTPYNYFNAWAFSRTDGLVTYSRKIMDDDIRRFNFPEERTCIIPPGVKPYTGPIKNMRQELGIKEGERVIGVIGRLKPDRGYDVILRAFKLVRERMNNAKLLILGRSSQIEKSIIKPLAEMGIERDVILAGYRIEDYFSVIATFDAFVMMRAGSDGTARALREVMAMGKPAIVSDRGMLPELVEDGVTGYVVKWDSHILAEKMEYLLNNDTVRIDFGCNAKKAAQEQWSYRTQAQMLKQFYNKLIGFGARL